MTEDMLAAVTLAPYVHDPRGFVETQYPWGEGDLEGEDIREWQGKILDIIGEHLQNEKTRYEPLQIAVASGHGIGKSALMAWLTQWGMCTAVDTIGMITANTDNQLRTKTWREQNTWYNRLACRSFFKLDGMTLRSRMKGHTNTWRFDAVNWSDTNTESVQGYHNKGKRLLLLIDEASAVPYEIFEALMGALTDEFTEIIMVLFGNPTRPNGFFFDCFNRNRAFWRRMQIDSRTVPGTNKSLFKQWEKQYGEDSDFFRVRVKGQFPKTAFDQLIAYETVTAAQEREDVTIRVSDPLILGCDIARFGDDINVVYPRKGKVAGHIHNGPWIWTGRADNVLMARRIAKLIREVKPDLVAIDGGGPGGGVIDILREWKYDQQTMIVEVAFGGASGNTDYANKRAEMWFEMNQWLLDGGSIPWDDQDLATDLTNQTYQYQEGRGNALILTPKQVMKKDGLPSPDHADALALTFATPIAPNTGAAARLAAVHEGVTDETEYVGGWE